MVWRCSVGGSYFILRALDNMTPLSILEVVGGPHVLFSTLIHIVKFILIRVVTSILFMYIHMYFSSICKITFLENEVFLRFFENR